MHIQIRNIVAVVVAGLSLGAHATTNDTSTGPSTITVTPVITTTPTANTGTTIPAPVGDATQGTRLVNQYTRLAGSSTNAQSLVTGLRTGTPITLQGTSTQAGSSSAPPTASAVTFTAPTQPMGWGNVSKALSLAQADLAAAGITHPTPQQLQTALTGGEITTTQGATAQTVRMDGILTMRNQGMGWGQIAHRLDLHPGTAFKSGQASLADHHEHRLQTFHHDETEMHENHHASTAGGSLTGATSRVTSASGKTTHTDSTSSRHDGDYQSAHAEHAISSHIVSAGGAPMAGVSSPSAHIEHGGSHGELQTVSHVTTASSGGAFAVGGSTNHGNSTGHGKP